MQGSPSQVCSGLGGWLLKPHPAYGLDLPKNITEVYGTNGGIKTAYTYTPYGLVTSTGSVTQPLQWSSEYADTDLALVYYNYRHYTPLDGRWTGRDPIAEAGGYNLNIYASNLPLNAWDNLGLFLDFLYSDDKGSLKAGTYEVTSPVPVLGGFPFGTVTVGTPNKSDGGKQSITLAIGITWGISFLNRLKKYMPSRAIKVIEEYFPEFQAAAFMEGGGTYKCGCFDFCKLGFGLSLTMGEGRRGSARKGKRSDTKLSGGISGEMRGTIDLCKGTIAGSLSLVITVGVEFPTTSLLGYQFNPAYEFSYEVEDEREEK